MKRKPAKSARPALSHLSKSGQARMVDVGGKTATARTARATAVVHLGPKIASALKRTGALAKGNVIETARLAGILAAKRTAEIIPMCHPLALDAVEISTAWRADALHIETVVRCTGRTGVEMEALSAAAIAALTVYDMCKSADKGIVITDLRLVEKSGGKSGHWKAGRGSRRPKGASRGNS